MFRKSYEGALVLALALGLAAMSFGAIAHAISASFNHSAQILADAQSAR
jgi:hypothetical protein